MSHRDALSKDNMITFSIQVVKGVSVYVEYEYQFICLSVFVCVRACVRVCFCVTVDGTGAYV